MKNDQIKVLKINGWLTGIMSFSLQLRYVCDRWTFHFKSTWFLDLYIVKKCLFHSFTATAHLLTFFVAKYVLTNGFSFINPCIFHFLFFSSHGHGISSSTFSRKIHDNSRIEQFCFLIHVRSSLKMPATGNTSFYSVNYVKAYYSMKFPLPTHLPYLPFIFS